MKFYGSIQNRISERSLQPIPEVGMGATLIMYSDRHAFTVLEVSKEIVQYSAIVKYSDGSFAEINRSYPKYIIATQDKAIKKPGSSWLDNDYTFETDENKSYALKFVFNKTTGLYREATQTYNQETNSYEYSNITRKDNRPIVVGYRDEYFDPSF